MKDNILSKNKNSIMAFLIALALPFALCGCHTVEGAGTDIQQAGKALEHSAERNQDSYSPCPTCSQPVRVCPKKRYHK